MALGVAHEDKWIVVEVNQRGREREEEEEEEDSSMDSRS